MWVAIGAGLQLILLIVQKMFNLSDEKKETAKAILQEAPNAKDAQSIIHLLDRVNRL
jgi:uncharacterized membrane protein YvbJ